MKDAVLGRPGIFEGDVAGEGVIDPPELDVDVHCLKERVARGEEAWGRTIP